MPLIIEIEKHQTATAERWRESFFSFCCIYKERENCNLNIESTFRTHIKAAYFALPVTFRFQQQRQQQKFSLFAFSFFSKCIIIEKENEENEKKNCLI